MIGFAILPRDWELGHKDTFVYNSWRMFVLACGLPSLLAAILISRMPESPRFLLLQGHHDKTRRVLVHMFVTNTKLPPESYHVSIAKTQKSIFKLKCFTNLLKVSCLRKAITVWFACTVVVLYTNNLSSYIVVLLGKGSKHGRYSRSVLFSKTTWC